MDTALKSDLHAHALLPCREGSSLDAYVQTATDILFNPQGAIGQVDRAYEAHQSAGEGDQ